MPDTRRKETFRIIPCLGLNILAQAEAWAAKDPYKAADLFESVELIPWNKVI